MTNPKKGVQLGTNKWIQSSLFVFRLPAPPESPIPQCPLQPCPPNCTFQWQHDFINSQECRITVSEINTFQTWSDILIRLGLLLHWCLEVCWSTILNHQWPRLLAWLSIYKCCKTVNLAAGGVGERWPWPVPWVMSQKAYSYSTPQLNHTEFLSKINWKVAGPVILPPLSL